MIGRSLVALLFTGTLASCVPAPDASGAGTPAQSPGAIFFPVLKPASVTPAAALEGRLVLQDGCLWIERASPKELYLGLWPPGSRLDLAVGNVGIVDSSGIRLATVGDELRSVGGETKEISEVLRFTGQTPPSACQRGEAYWRAYQLTRRP